MKIRPIKAFSAALFFLGVAFFLIHLRKEGQEKDVVINVKKYIISSFVSELPDINKKLPHKVDENTTLNAIDYISGKVISRFEISHNNANSNIDPEKIRKTVLTLKKSACNDELRKTLLDVDVEFLDKYQDTNGVVLFDVSTNKSICAEWMRD